MIKAEKKRLRSEILSQRNRLRDEDVKERSRLICQRLVPLLDDLSPEVVLSYLAHGKEVDPDGFIDALAKRGSYAVPVVEPQRGEMRFGAFRRGDPVSTNRYGIREPEVFRSIDWVDEEAVILIPAVAVDQCGYRLGFGGGYYDRFLASHPNLMRIAIVYQFQVVDTLPKEQHDMPVHYIVTESKLVKLS